MKLKIGKMKSKVVLAAAVAALSGTVSAVWPFGGAEAAEGKDFVLAEDGLAKAAIVVGRESPGYRWAANELADYLAKLTGARFTVADRPLEGMGTVWVGDPKGPAKRDFEELEISVRDGSTLVLDGDGPRGTLYAVYEMLEDFGVGFYTWDWDYVPPATNRLALAAGHRKRTKPWMVCRKSWSGPTWGSGEDHFRYQMRLRYHDSSGTKDLWAKYGMGEATSFSNAPSYSIAQTLCSHYVPRKRFFDEKKSPKEYRPEWYAWNAAEKRRHGHFVCVSNDGMFRELVAELEADVRKEVAARPGEKVEISIGLDDGSVRCDCEKCMKLSEGVANRGLAAAACQYIALANRVARHFAKKYPQVRFNILSYDGFGPTPANPEKFRLEPNAGVGVALLWRNFGRPIAACERAPASVADWMKITPNGIANWDYYANFNCWYVPFPNLDTMGENWRYYKAHNVNRMDSQNQWSVLGDLADLHFWLYSKLSWDPDADDRALIGRFCRDVYGAAAKHILEYIDFLQHCRDRQRGLWTGCYVLSTDGYLSGADCARIYKLFCDAENAVRKDSARKRNVARAKFGVLALAGIRYADMVEPAKRIVRLPPREKILKEFYETGILNDVGNGALWAGEYQSFDSLQKLMKGPEKPVAKSAQAKSRFVGGDELSGGKKMAKAKDDEKGATIAAVDMRNPSEQLYSIFMCDGNRDVSYTLKDGEAGDWYVFADLRVDSDDAGDPAAAYFSFRQPFANDTLTGKVPEEIVSLFVSGGREEKGWRTVSFGRYPMRAGATVYMFPGVVKPLNSYAVRSFSFVSAAVMDDERNAARYLGANRLKAVGGKIEKERFDGFQFARVGDGTNVVADAKVVATVPRQSAGTRHLLARVRIGSKKYLATDVARLTLKTKGGEEIATARVGGSPYDDSWQIVSLGKHALEEGMTVEFALAPEAEARFLDVRNLWAVEPELMERSVK